MPDISLRAFRVVFSQGRELVIRARCSSFRVGTRIRYRVLERPRYRSGEAVGKKNPRTISKKRGLSRSPFWRHTHPDELGFQFLRERSLTIPVMCRYIENVKRKGGSFLRCKHDIFRQSVRVAKFVIDIRPGSVTSAITKADLRMAVVIAGTIRRVESRWSSTLTFR